MFLFQVYLLHLSSIYDIPLCHPSKQLNLELNKRQKEIYGNWLWEEIDHCLLTAAHNKRESYSIYGIYHSCDPENKTLDTMAATHQ